MHKAQKEYAMIGFESVVFDVVAVAASKARKNGTHRADEFRHIPQSDMTLTRPEWFAPDRWEAMQARLARSLNRG